MPSDNLPERVDLAIIGGGPSGSTVASLVARAGYSVLVLEKDSHPRFHIGESLLPHNMPIFRRLGLEDAIKAIGVRKPGVDFTTPAAEEQVHEIRFTEALGLREGCEHAYQVLRSDFDKLMFEKAGHDGAQVVMNAVVREIDFDEDDNPVLSVEQPGLPEQIVRARFVVDASGRHSFLARRFNLQERNRDHATAALFGHFRNVPRRDGASAGNISIYWFDQGWIWMIPLPDGVMSVGAVCNPDYLRQRGRDVEGFFNATIKRNPHAGKRMAEAELMSPITATGNYSYYARRLDGPSWLLVGDAGVFVDPVFSSGVFFGMHSGELAADVIVAELSGDAAASRRARARYRDRVQRGVRELSWFIYRFPTPAMRRLFVGSSSLLGMKESVIAVLAGDVYDNRAVRWRIRLFRLVYALVSLIDLPATLRVRRQRKRNARVVFDRGI